METSPSLLKISVTWRREKFVLEMNLGATVKDLGQELQRLTNIKEDTMRLIVPQISNKTPKLLSPFSKEHAFLSLQETSIAEARSIKMMGVLTNEVEEVLQNAKANFRIAGFEEEEKRLKQRTSYGPSFSLKLPQGPYIFAEFRTLEIPGVELNPPPSEALKRMHMLAADPGIVAVMNKHRWRVAIMTEMAPVGYVGISPKCILGFNKNHGEEISLRLRTDDLKGFRKYESIKKTLLHELAHMIYSEHDANFYALDKQLNQEADSLDWTRSASQTLSGVRNTTIYEEDIIANSSSIAQKLGGNRTGQVISARESSVAAAYHRIANDLAKKSGWSEENLELESDYSSFSASENPDQMISLSKEITAVDKPILFEKNHISEPDCDDHVSNEMKHEPDPDDSDHSKACGFDVCLGTTNSRTEFEKKPIDTDILSRMDDDKPDSDVEVAEKDNLRQGTSMLLDSIGSMLSLNAGAQVNENCNYEEPSHAESRAEINVMEEPDPDDAVVSTPSLSTAQTDEPDPDDHEIQRINDPVTAVCNRIRRALEMLTGEYSPPQTTSILQTLLKIIRNVIEHPEDTKYKRLRKANPVIERNIMNNKAALEILLLVGFCEDVMLDNLGKAEAYLVLKRNDPGLLWLAKSTLESCKFV